MRIKGITKPCDRQGRTPIFRIDKGNKSIKVPDTRSTIKEKERNLDIGASPGQQSYMSEEKTKTIRKKKNQELPMRTDVKF